MLAIILNRKLNMKMALFALACGGPVVSTFGMLMTINRRVAPPLAVAVPRFILAVKCDTYVRLSARE